MVRDTAEAHWNISHSRAHFRTVHTLIHINTH